MNLRKHRSKLIYLTSIIVAMLIVISFAISLIGSNEVGESAVITTSSADFIETDLLIGKNTRSTQVNGNVFNATALEKLYSKLAGENATFADVEDNAKAQKNTYANNSVKSIHSGMDSQDIRTANGKNIVVKLDGKDWIVTALTTTDNSNSAHVILTLMLKDVAYDSNWGAWKPSSNTDFSATYPSTMYSTSYIRAGLLNNGTKYTSNGSNLVDFTDTDIYGDDGYPFGIYTNTSETGSITNFIIKPNQVLYQQYENWYDIMQGTQGSNVLHTSPNDSSKYDIPSNKWYSGSGTIAVQGKTNYYDWGNDLLWIPSVSETGQNTSQDFTAYGGIWRLNADQWGISNSKFAWVRSGAHHNATSAWYLTATGSLSNTAVTSTSISDTNGGTFAVRPAFNLDLTLADQSSAYVFDVPEEFSIEYNGNPQGVETQSWYTSSFASIVSVEYFDRNSQSPISKPTVFGDYMVKLTIGGSNVWSDDKNGNERLVDFSIDKKKIDFPKFIGDNVKEYNGNQGVEFQVEYNSDYLNYYTISVPSGPKYNDVSFSNSSYKVTAYDVENYQLVVTLNDTANTRWRTNNNKLEFQVAKAQIDLSITDTLQNSALTGAVGDIIDVYI
ncbi:MAG: hypothetical protein K2I23_02415, partial [Clostridia bacterium]|nr:hypothetical protein [Clostridia bacterium]